MAEGDTIVVRDGHQVLGPATLLTGGETAQGNFFRGPDDPADTPAYLAILEPGDLWVDTSPIANTGTFPVLYQHKERNAANDGWQFVPLVAADGDGNLAALVYVDPTGSITLNSLDDAGGVRGSVLLTALSGISVMVQDAGGTPVTGLALGWDGVFSMLGSSFTMSGLPTVNPADGSLWNDAGVVKVSS